MQLMGLPVMHCLQPFQQASGQNHKKQAHQTCCKKRRKGPEKKSTKDVLQIEMRDVEACFCCCLFTDSAVRYLTTSAVDSCAVNRNCPLNDLQGRGRNRGEAVHSLRLWAVKFPTVACISTSEPGGDAECRPQGTFRSSLNFNNRIGRSQKVGI